jgi:hypothetical protein
MQRDLELKIATWNLELQRRHAAPIEMQDIERIEIKNWQRMSNGVEHYE